MPLHPARILRGTVIERTCRCAMQNVLAHLRKVMNSFASSNTLSRTNYGLIESSPLITPFIHLLRYLSPTLRLKQIKI